MHDNKTNEELLQISVDKITVNPNQPRRHFSLNELEELAASIISVGLIHPPLVRPCHDGFYELVSGERRFRAAQLAGFTTIPVMVRHHTQEMSAQAALIENIQRVDLNPMEIAKSLRSLSEQFHWNQEELALRVGKKRSTVANYLRLLALPKNIQDSVSQNVISMGHAKAILSLEGFERQHHLHEMILRDGLTVRDAEEAAHQLANPEKKPATVAQQQDVFLKQITEDLQHKLGTKVSIQGKGDRGRITIDYYNLDDLDRLLHLFGLNEN